MTQRRGNKAKSMYGRSEQRHHRPVNGEIDDNFIPLYEDEGCHMFPKCTECPLVTCYLDYDDGIAHNLPQSKAVEASWNAGVRHPDFDKWWKQPSGAPIPDDVFKDIVGASKRKVENMGYGEKKAVARRLSQFHTATKISHLLGVKPASVREWVKQ